MFREHAHDLELTLKHFTAKFLDIHNFHGERLKCVQVMPETHLATKFYVS